MIKKQAYTKEIHNLISDVFKETLAPYYSPDGIASFQATIDEYDYLNEHLTFYVHDHDGVIAIDEADDRIVFLFVKKRHQGIGRSLINYVIASSDSARLIVNADLTAVDFYQRCGFEKAGEPVTIDDITTIEMVHLRRCSWVPHNDPQYIAYHDQEWCVETHDEHTLYEMFILELFQAGLSWATILHKRDNFRQAYDGFDIEKVRHYDEKKIEELMGNPGIIRHRKKIEASITNSQIFYDIVQTYGSFDHYIWHFTNNQVVYEDPDTTHNALSDEVSIDLKKRGVKFAGSVTIYSYLQAIGIINSHDENCFKYHQKK